MNLAAIRTFFGFMCDRGWLVGNPSNLASVDYRIMSHEQKEAAVRQPFTTLEIKKLLGFIKAEWDEATNELAKLVTPKRQNLLTSTKGIQFQERIEQMRFWDFAVRLSHETDLRLGDICGLEWKCFGHGTITVHTKKTGKRIEIPVSDNLLDLVSNIPIEHKDYVFPR